MNNRLIGLIAVLALASAGCTQPTTSPAPTLSGTSTNATSQSATPNASPTPTQSWNEEQAAAIAAVDGYRDVVGRLAEDPSQFSRAEIVAALKKYGAGAMSDPTWFLDLARQHHRQTGSIHVLRVTPSKVIDNYDARGRDVHVVVCQDQTDLRIVDSKGKPVASQKPERFNLRQYTVRQPKDSDRWTVVGATTINGECG